MTTCNINLWDLTVDGSQSFITLTILPLMFSTNLGILSPYVCHQNFFFSLFFALSPFFVPLAFNGVGFHAKGSVLLNVDCFRSSYCSSLLLRDHHAIFLISPWILLSTHFDTFLVFFLFSKIENIHKFLFQIVFKTIIFLI